MTCSWAVWRKPCGQSNTLKILSHKQQTRRTLASAQTGHSWSPDEDGVGVWASLLGHVRCKMAEANLPSLRPHHSSSTVLPTIRRQVSTSLFDILLTSGQSCWRLRRGISAGPTGCLRAPLPRRLLLNHSSAPTLIPLVTGPPAALSCSTSCQFSALGSSSAPFRPSTVVACGRSLSYQVSLPLRAPPSPSASFT